MSLSGKQSGQSLRHLKELGSWTSWPTAAFFFPLNGNSQKSPGSTRQPARNDVPWNGSVVGDILPDGKAIVSTEWGGPSEALYLQVYRKLDGSAPVALGPGGQPRFSPDGTLVARPLLTRPPQVALNPVGTGESRRLPAGEITSLKFVAWFPDGKHLLLTEAAQGESLRTYEMDMDGGKPQSLGPADFIGVAVSGDGQADRGKERLWRGSGV